MVDRLLQLARADAVRANSALVTDAYGRRYRAFYNAAQRGR
jgi:hypothetical protein